MTLTPQSKQSKNYPKTVQKGNPARILIGGTQFRLKWEGGREKSEGRGEGKGGGN